MTEQITEIDEGLVAVYKSQLYEKIMPNQRPIYSSITALEQTTINQQTNVVPPEVNFNIPNTFNMDTQASYLFNKIRIPFTAGQLTGKTVYQQNCGIWMTPTAELPSTANAQLVKRLPLSARQFYKTIHLYKANKMGEEFSFEQDNKHRDNNFTKFVDQDQVNRQLHNQFFFNNNMKILYTGEVADDATTAVYWEFALTMAEISPVFGTRRYFPLGNLNEPLTLKLTPNANAFQSVGDQYYGFRIKTVYYDQPQAQAYVKEKGMAGIFNDYFRQTIQSQTLAQEQTFKITQTYESLNMIQIQVLQAIHDTNWWLGFSNLDGSYPQVGNLPLHTIGNMQFTHEEKHMFIQKLNSWTDVLRYNAQDGKMLNILNDITSQSTNKTFDYNFNTWINQFVLLLEDNINQINSATAGYRGLKVNSTSNTQLTFQMLDYSSNLLSPQVLTSSDPCVFEVMQYYSKFLILTPEGDLKIEL